MNEKFPNLDERPPLYLLMHSPGGGINSAYVIAKTLRKNFKQIVTFIPHIAASGATLISLASNEIIMGDISRLSRIDPYLRDNDEVLFALSIARAFSNFEEYFSDKTVEEAPYPWQHLVRTITAEKYDRAVMLLSLVENYAKELLIAAEYNENKAEKIAYELTHVGVHQEALTIDKVKKIGLKVLHYTEKQQYNDIWQKMRMWLRRYLLESSPIHIIRYAFPEVKT